MPRYRLKIPDLILVEPIYFTFFVIDFNGPTMASDACDPPGLPLQLVTDEVGARIREISLSMIDDQSMLAKVMDMMGFTITVVGLFFSFIGDGQFSKDGIASTLNGLLVLLLEVSIKHIQSLLSCF
jgi:hypothetical protein